MNLSSYSADGKSFGIGYGQTDATMLTKTGTVNQEKRFVSFEDFKKYMYFTSVTVCLSEQIIIHEMLNSEIV